MSDNFEAITRPIGEAFTRQDAKNPNGYCNLGPNGLTCPVGVARVSGAH